MTQRGDHRTGPRRGLRSLALLFLATALAAGSAVVTADAGAAAPGRAAVQSAAPSPSFGPNVTVFDPSMPVADIQAKVDAIAAQQVGNEMGSARYALLFKPGSYGSAAQPLNFQVGYYTEVAGLGRDPGDVVINGSVYVRNQCTNGNCIALNNFWRSMSNLTINVTNPDFGCYFGEFWAVSQAAPLRRVHVKGQTTLMDYCTGPSFASGGFIADSQFDAGRHQRVAAAVLHPQQRAHQLEQRCVEPGLLRHHRRSRRVLPRHGDLRPVHDRRDDIGEQGEALPLHRRFGRVQRLRAGTRHRQQRGDVGRGLDTGPLDPAEQVLRRQPLGLGEGDQP